MNSYVDLSSSRWKKVLYLMQPFPDNYVDPTIFCKDIQIIASYRPFKYDECIWRTLHFTTYFNLLVLHIIGWYAVKERLVSYWLLINGHLIFLFIKIYFKICDGLQIHGIGSLIRKYLGVYGCLWMLSPVLKTLTTNISDGVLYTIVSALLVAHLSTHNYTNYTCHDAQSNHTNSGASSTSTSGVVAAVLLASRLSTALEVFTHLFWGIQLFSKEQSTCIPLKARREDQIQLFQVALIGVSIGILMHLNYILGLMYLICTIAVTFLFPLIVVFCQKFKVKIVGNAETAKVAKATEFLSQHKHKLMNASKFDM